MKARKYLTTLSTAENAAKQYLLIEEQMKELRAEQEKLKTHIKQYLSECTPMGRAILDQREFYLCEQTREVFDLKRARAVLRESQVKPFVRLSTSVLLRHK